MTSPDEVARRVVVVTGASGGVGRAVAREFAGRGDKVALLARGAAGLDGAAKEIEAAGGVALPISVDVADHGAHGRFDRTAHKRGPLLWVQQHRVAVGAAAAVAAAGVLRLVRR